MAPSRRLSGRGIARWIFLALLIIPLVEILIIIAVGNAIGGWWTLLLLVAFSAFGAWLVKREGGRTWHALQEALRGGQMPAKEIADAALVLVGGTLLLTPGFMTDATGLFLVLPFTRPITRRWLQAAVASRLLGGVVGASGPSDPTTRRRQRAPGEDDVIEGEIISDDPPPEH